MIESLYTSPERLLCTTDGFARLCRHLTSTHTSTAVAATTNTSLTASAAAAAVTAPSSSLLLTRRVVEKYLHDIEQPSKLGRLKEYAAAANPTSTASDSKASTAVAPNAKLWYLTLRLIFNASDVLRRSTLYVFLRPTSARYRLLKRLRAADAIEFSGTTTGCCSAADTQAMMTLADSDLSTPGTSAMDSARFAHKHLLACAERMISELHALLDSQSLLPAPSADTQLWLHKWLLDLRLSKSQ